MPGSSADIVFSQEDRAGLIRLNRPQQRHALTTAMLTGMREQLQDWRNSPAVELVILEAAGDDGFCGGADLGALCKGPLPDSQIARAFWSEGAHLAATIAHYSKPIVVLVDGLAAGSGVGLTAHATYRVVTERARLALPETTIGLVPDLGLTWLISRSAGPLGTYLALTGQPLDAGATIQVGLADGLIAADKLQEMRDRLISPFGGPVERVLNGFVTPAGLGNLAADHDLITAAFAEQSVEAILAALDQQGERGAQIKATLASRSPLALKLTLALLQRVQGLRKIEEALIIEHRLLNRLFEFGELQEGVRARLIDADRAPAWAFAELADIDTMLVNSCFAPLLPGEDLKFDL